MVLSGDSPGVIEPGRLYVVEEARQRLRLGRKSWRELREAGLPVTYRGRQAFVFSDDLLRLFAEQKQEGAER